MTSVPSSPVSPAEHLPFWARLEWHLSRVSLLRKAIKLVFQMPRRRWHEHLWKARQTPHSLSRFESKVYSQNGEDGILQEIFKRIGTQSKFSVEFGVGDGSECCTRNLLMNHGWTGLVMDGGEKNIQNARRLYEKNPGAQAACEYIKVENIRALFEKYSVPNDLDLLVIDIDGNDYWVWRSLMTNYRPRVVVIEYNARWVPPMEWVMPYNPDHTWKDSSYFGASLESLARLGQGFGYRLVGCDSVGVNAFFVRDDLMGDKFPDHEKGTAFLYAPPRYGTGFGHPIRDKGM